MKQIDIEVVSYQSSRFLRLLSYSLLSLILLIAQMTEANIEFFHLLVIPISFCIIAIEHSYLNWLEKILGSNSRTNIMFMTDVVLSSVFISALHVALIPSISIIGSLLYSAIFRQIKFIYILLMPMLGIAVFYFFGYLLMGVDGYVSQSSTGLNVVSMMSLLTFIAATMYFHTQKIQKLFDQKNYYHKELNRYAQLNSQLARYAPLQIYQSIMRGEIEAKIEYKRRKLSIFFSDIQGFTELSDQLIPDDLAFLLNDYLTHMTEIAKHHGGTIDKFMGDGILIFFGDPSSRGVREDAISCIDMAVAMRQQMRVLRERWIKLGFSSLHIRMGVATGYCHVGNYGTADRMSYSIVGRDANIAARLQSVADVDQILIADETFHLIKEHYLCIKHPPLKLKGINGFTESWQVMERYHDSVDKYRRWYDFEYKGFNLLLNLDKTPIYQYPELINVMEKTIQRLKLQQQETDVDGVVPLSNQDLLIYDASGEQHTPADEQHQSKLGAAAKKSSP